MLLRFAVACGSHAASCASDLPARDRSHAPVHARAPSDPLALYTPARPGPHALLSVEWGACEVAPTLQVPEDDEFATLLAPSAPLSFDGIFLSAELFVVNPHRRKVFVQPFAVSVEQPRILTKTACGPTRRSPPILVAPGSRASVGVASVVVTRERPRRTARVTVSWEEGLHDDSDELVARHAIFEVVAELSALSCEVHLLHPTSPSARR